MGLYEGQALAPTRKTSEVGLNEWNVAMRQSPAYQAFLQSLGQGQGRPTKLSDSQQKQLENLLARSGVPVPKGMHIDQAGNLNQKSHLVRNIAITAGIAAAALATGGAAGFGPLAGLMSGGGAAAGGAGAAGSALGAGGATATGIGTAALPAAIAGVPAGLGTAVAIPTVAGLGTAAGGLGTAASVASAAGAGKSLGGKLVGALLNPNVLEAAGRGLGSIGATQANNRGVALDAMMLGDQQRMQNDINNRNAAKEGLRQMQITNYIKNGGAGDYKPIQSASGGTFTNFGFGPKAATQDEINYANEMEAQLTDRLKHPVELSDYSSKMEPGGLETAMNWLGPAATVASAIRGGGQYQPPANSTRRYF